MIIVLIILWFLLGLLAAIIIKANDGKIPLLAAIFFIAAGAISLLVVFAMWLEEVDI